MYVNMTLRALLVIFRGDCHTFVIPLVSARCQSHALTKLSSLLLQSPPSKQIKPSFSSQTRAWQLEPERTMTLRLTSVYWQPL